MELTPEQRRLRASIAAHEMHAQGKTNTAPARRAFEARWERLVDPDGTLPVEERVRRAEHARKAHYQRLSLAGVRARAQGGR